MRHIIRLKIVMITVMLTAVAAVNAHSTTLDVLLNGGSLIAGDKLFDRWSLTGYTASDPLRSFNAANIDVSALNDGGLDPGPGLQFIISNNELDVTGDGTYAFVDLTFAFRVSVLNSNQLIKDNTLAYTMVGPALVWTTDGSNDLGCFILENIGTTSGLADLGTKDIDFSVLDDVQTSKLFDSAAFVPQSEIWVTKNILVWSVDTTDTASLWGFEQRFSQVPEPATIGLMLLGLLTVGFLKRVK